MPGNGEWLPGSGRLTGTIRQHKFNKWLKKHPNAGPRQKAKARERIYNAIPDRSRVKKYQ